MFFYLINLACNMLFGYSLLKFYKNEKIAKLIYLIATALQLLLITGLRGLSVGTDTNTYYNYYNNVKEIKTLSGLLENRTEFFYLLICKFADITNGGYQLVLFITGLIIIFGFLKFINDYSKNVLLSVFLFITLGYFAISLNGVRHYLATVFIINSFKYIHNRQIFKYLIMFVIAFNFHNSSIIFLPLYIIGYIRWDIKKIIVLLISLIFIFISIKPIATYVINHFLPKYVFYLDTAYFQKNTGLLRVVVDAPIIIFISTIFLFNHIKKQSLDKKTHMFFSCTLIVFACLVLSYKIQMMVERFAQYIFPMFIVIIPHFINMIENTKYRKLITFGIIIVCIFHYIVLLDVGWQRTIPYIPFWL